MGSTFSVRAHLFSSPCLILIVLLFPLSRSLLSAHPIPHLAPASLMSTHHSVSSLLHCPLWVLPYWEQFHFTLTSITSPPFKLRAPFPCVSSLVIITKLNQMRHQRQSCSVIKPSILSLSKLINSSECVNFATLTLDQVSQALT